MENKIEQKNVAVKEDNFMDVIMKYISYKKMKMKMQAMHEPCQSKQIKVISINSLKIEKSLFVNKESIAKNCMFIKLKFISERKMKFSIT